MNMMAPTRPADHEVGDAAMTREHLDEDLMTRKQVAYLFRVTSAAVAKWARRGRLPEVRNEVGRPRYRRADVEALFQSGFQVEGAMERQPQQDPPGAGHTRHCPTASG